MKLNIKLKIIFSLLLLSSAFAEAITAPKCSAVLMFQKQEVEAKVTAVVKIILIHQMITSNGIKGDNAAFIEATRQINEIVKNFPEMLGFYNAEMARLAKKDSAIKTKVKKVTEDHKILDNKRDIEDSVVIIEIDKKPQFIFKNKDGTYFTIGDNKEFVDFFNQLNEIQQVIPNKYRSAIAILHKDGSVLTWGNKDAGGESSHLKLDNVKAIYSNSFAFAALKKDGSVITWGHKNYGGEVSHSTLKNVKSIYSTEYAFAAHMNDGSVITWGGKDYGGDSSHLNLKNVKTIISSATAFAALINDGSVITWGDKRYGGNTSHLKLTDVKAIFSTDTTAFAALKNDDSVITWGNENVGGKSDHVDLTNVKSIYSTNGAFSALKNDGSVISWGAMISGGFNLGLDLTNVKSIFSTERAFAALKNDGTVITWGHKELGADSSLVQEHLYDIVHIIEVKTGSFLALRKDGKYVLWGQPIGQFQNQVLDFDLM